MRVEYLIVIATAIGKTLEHRAWFSAGIEMPKVDTKLPAQSAAALTHMLNYYGRDGWDLSTLVTSDDEEYGVTGYTATFKRIDRGDCHE